MLVATLDLNRFVVAQSPVYAEVLEELRRGQKASHWMWFVFPQLRGLGRSSTAQHFALAGLEEAAAYAAHPVLGSRLKECVGLVNRVSGRTAHEIFGSPDDLKFRSSMTLFALAVPHEPCFRKALHEFFEGRPDELTLRELGARWTE